MITIRDKIILSLFPYFMIERESYGTWSFLPLSSYVCDSCILITNKPVVSLFYFFIFFLSHLCYFNDEFSYLFVIMESNPISFTFINSCLAVCNLFVMMSCNFKILNTWRHKLLQKTVTTYSIKLYEYEYDSHYVQYWIFTEMVH